MGVEVCNYKSLIMIPQRGSVLLLLGILMCSTDFLHPSYTSSDPILLIIADGPLT